jgi:hypothetical protein
MNPDLLRPGSSERLNRWLLASDLVGALAAAAIAIALIAH